MALSFIGKPISLISHSDVRYRGVLAGIDPAASTIQLSNVYSMGTESRRPATEFIPPVQEPYQYIIFRASEVKDLAVDEPTPRRSVHDDPAVLGAGAPSASSPYVPYVIPYPQPQPGPAQPQPQQPHQQLPPQTQQPLPQPQQPLPQNTLGHPQSEAQAPGALPPPANITTDAGTAAPGANASGGAAARPAGRRTNPVHTAAASLETVERALGDLRVSNGMRGHGHGHGHPRRGHGHGHGGIKAGEIKVPAADFDFQVSNARFDKAALALKRAGSGSSKGDADKGEDDQRETDPSEEGGEGAKAVEKGAYNPQKSFFDSLSSSTLAPSPRATPGASNNHNNGTGEGRRRGGGGGRNRREEERERNVATFGEPGGVGLMGPGAYVGGWGGYGRRGGRARRGLGVGGDGR